MTRPTTHKAESTPFSLWLKEEPDLDSAAHVAALSISDVDFVVHQYLKNNIMLIEEKRYGGDLRTAQKDTLSVVNQMLKVANGTVVKTKRGVRPVNYYGYHILVMSGTTPDDSEWMTWDGKRIDKRTLKKLLRFELDPKTYHK